LVRNSLDVQLLVWKKKMVVIVRDKTVSWRRWGGGGAGNLRIVPSVSTCNQQENFNNWTGFQLQINNRK